jgi:hypothetical protein
VTRTIMRETTSIYLMAINPESWPTAYSYVVIPSPTASDIWRHGRSLITPFTIARDKWADLTQNIRRHKYLKKLDAYVFHFFISDF